MGTRLSKNVVRTQTQVCTNEHACPMMGRITAVTKQRPWYITYQLTALVDALVADLFEFPSLAATPYSGLIHTRVLCNVEVEHFTVTSLPWKPLDMYDVRHASPLLITIANNNSLKPEALTRAVA